MMEGEKEYKKWVGGEKSMFKKRCKFFIIGQKIEIRWKMAISCDKSGYYRLFHSAFIPFPSLKNQAEE